MALVFIAGSAAGHDAEASSTLYVVRMRTGQLKAEAVLTQPGLWPELALTRYIIVRSRDTRFLWGLAQTEPRPVKAPYHHVWLPGPEQDTAISLGQMTPRYVQVCLLHANSMHVDVAKFPTESGRLVVGIANLHYLSARMSPGRARVAVFAQPRATQGATAKGWSLVVLDRRAGPRVLEAGLCPQWSTFASWWQGPSLEWLDDQRISYVASPEGSLKIAEVETGHVSARVHAPREGKWYGGMLWRDRASGVVASFRGNGGRLALAIIKAGPTGRIEAQEVAPRFVVRRQSKDAEVVRDTVTGAVIWRGPLGRCHLVTPSLRSDVVALMVRPTITDSAEDIYVYDARAGGSRKVFHGYREGRAYWIRE